MSVPIETGTLPIGVMFEGQRCRKFTLRPLKARDSMEVRKSEDAQRALSDDELMGLALLGKRLSIEGIPDTVQNLAFMEDLWDDDLAAIMAAEGRLQEALARFRGEDAPAAYTGAAQGGAAVERGPVDAGGGSAAVDRGLGGAQNCSGAAREEEEDPTASEAP